VEITPALAADLALLSQTLDVPGADIAETLSQLTSSLKAAIPTFQGLTISSMAPEYTFITVDARVDVAAAGASLLVPVPTSGSAIVTLVLYAARPGAFVDLAADLAYLLELPLTALPLDQHLSVPRFGDRPTPLQVSSLIDQAVGVLIARGYTPEQARAGLDARAAHERTDRYGAARTLLDSTPDPDAVTPL
jgi:hypothetical protein